MIDWHAVLAISCLLAAAGIGITLAWKNCHDEARIKRNLEARREFKREKNRRLARFYGIKYDK